MSSIHEQIQQGWREIGKELKPEELVAYTQNGPVRQLLTDCIHAHTMDIPSYVIEVGSLLHPFCQHMTEIGIGFSEALLIDPIYQVYSPLPVKGIRNISYASNGIPQDIPVIQTWSYAKPSTILILENVMNYISRDDITRLCTVESLHTIIVGNNSQGRFREMHPNRVKDPDDIQSLFQASGFTLTNSEPFISDATLAGIFVKNS